MKHHKKIRSFNRPSSQRKALMRSLARALIKEERIKTTEMKAKELRPYVERLITYGKRGDLANRRRVSALVGKDASFKVFSELTPRFEKRSGGYTRVIKLSPRKGDASPMAYIEFVDQIDI
ncbi:MAG: 50S ribosomal protein L17 [Candidatus Paceibacterota bacterium]